MSIGSGRLHPDMQVAMLCEKMGWTFQQYCSQPDWFIDLLLIKGNLDSQYQKREIRKAREK